MVILNVPFSEKDRVKALGARWSGDDRAWYVPDGVDPEPFATWLPKAARFVPSGHTGSHAIAESTIAAPSPTEAITGEKKHQTLSDFMTSVTRVITEQFRQPVWLLVEVSKFTNRTGHAYFDFIEYDGNGKEIAKAKGSLWAGRKEQLLAKFRTATGSDIQDGMKLLLQLKAEFNKQYGFSFIVEDIDPAYTLGDMQAKLKAIREALKRDGHYDINKRLPAPFDFTRVAVISPEGAAGLADFMRESEVLSNADLCEFRYFSAVFQGKDAPAAIIKAINEAKADHQHSPFDAVAIIRGGGAASDLAWLNDHNLAVAVANVGIPVFTGIGHQIDDTILDEIANRRFDTPSKVSAFIASTIVTNANAAIQHMVYIIKDTRKMLQTADALLDNAVTAINASSMRVVSKFEADVDALLTKIKSGVDTTISMTEQKLAMMMSEIMGLSPKNTLNRGYALVRSADGKPVTEAAALPAGTHISVELKDGKISAEVL